MQRDRHDYFEYGLGADDKKKVGTPERGENKIKSKNAQDQSSTAGRLGGGVLFFPKTSDGPSQSILMRYGHQRLLCKRAISGIT